MEIKKYVSRYVIPFYYDTEDDGYQHICDYFDKGTSNVEALRLPKDGKWDKAGFWEKYKSDKENQPEMELYTYLLTIFKEDNTEQKEDLTSLGNSYVYKTNGKLFQCRMAGDDKITFTCKDLGVLLLKNGIGFLWYEIEFSSQGITLEEYIDFQCNFKELARTNTTKFERKGYSEEEKMAIYEPFCLGKWLTAFLSCKENGIRFWSERSISAEDGKEIIPDKALLFQYLFVDEALENDYDNLAFRVANGYDMKYNAPSDIASHIYKPFGNMHFYISKAGMSCVVSNEGSNEKFFADQFREKFIRDYFYIYVLLCYQSYSCAHYSRLLTKLPADEKSFRTDSVFMDRLETLDSQVNLFLVKSVFNSVSNVHHQNEVYHYGKEVLCVNDDIQSLTIGLEALRDIERDKNDREVNNAISYFGLLVIISTLFDGVSLIDWLANTISGGKLSIRMFGYGGIIILVILFAIHLLKVLVKNKKDDK